MNKFDKPHFVEIDASHDGQRIDNFLITYLKGVPKSRVYRLIRKGELRINKKRCKQTYRLQLGDLIRIPPIRATEKVEVSVNSELKALIEQRVVFEDNGLIVINKPSGLAVHGGSGVSLGLIEVVRQIRPLEKFVELVHRLDRDTSGLIMIAKRRSVLTHLHALLRGDGVDKRYLALVKGKWSKRKTKVDAPLEKNHLQSGERMVRVSNSGKESLTEFQIVEAFEEATLIEAKPVTGRTHQIRVHAQYAGHPIAGDVKYGDRGFDQFCASLGIERLFLHAWQLSFETSEGELIKVEAPLEETLEVGLQKLRASSKG